MSSPQVSAVSRFAEPPRRPYLSSGREVRPAARRQRPSTSGSTCRLGDTAQGAFNAETLHSVGRQLTMPDPLPFALSPDRSSTPERSLTARGLWDAVLSARAAWAHERHLPQRGSEPIARLALVDALEAYVKSLDERGRPVPYALRDELRLQRLTCVTSRQALPVTTREELRHGHSVR